MFSRLQRLIFEIIHQPSKVFFFGALLTGVLLLSNGSLWRFWSLQSNQQEMVDRMVELEKKSKSLEFQIHQAKKLTYIEREATDKFDYVREGDLIFVFSE